jgi:hypothetical protein
MASTSGNESLKASPQQQAQQRSAGYFPLGYKAAFSQWVRSQSFTT